jgi:hypothetical protein
MPLVAFSAARYSRFQARRARVAMMKIGPEWRNH